MRAIITSDRHAHGTAPEKNARVDAARAYIDTAYPRHLIFDVGDTADDGSAAQYEILADHRVDVAVPGNHNYGYLGNLYDREAARRFVAWCRAKGIPDRWYGNNYPQVVDIEGQVRIIGLDSNLETRSPWDFACGEIGSRQLRALPKILDTGMRKVVLLHHHPFLHGDPTMRLRDADALARVLYGRVDVLAFGHKHLQALYRDVWGIPHVLACGALFKEQTAFEVIIDDEISVSLVPIREAA